MHFMKPFLFLISAIMLVLASCATYTETTVEEAPAIAEIQDIDSIGVPRMSIYFGGVNYGTLVRVNKQRHYNPLQEDPMGMGTFGVLYSTDWIEDQTVINREALEVTANEYWISLLTGEMPFGHNYGSFGSSFGSVESLSPEASLPSVQALNTNMKIGIGADKKSTEEAMEVLEESGLSAMLAGRIHTDISVVEIVEPADPMKEEGTFFIAYQITPEWMMLDAADGDILFSDTDMPKSMKFEPATFGPEYIELDIPAGDLDALDRYLASSDFTEAVEALIAGAIAEEGYKLLPHRRTYRQKVEE